MIETLITLVLVGIIAGVLAPTFMNATETRIRFHQRNTLLFKARTALERMTRELREMSVTSGVPDLGQATATRVDFGTTSYRQSGGNLERSSDGGTTWYTMAGGVSALTLAYQNLDGTALSPLPLDATNRQNVRRVVITLDMNFNSAAPAAELLTLRSQVYLRRCGY